VGFGRRAVIRAWAESLVTELGPDVAALVGVAPPLPRIHVRVVRVADHPASCSGATITLHEQWFADHPDDAGAVVHELSHAYLRLRRTRPHTSWLVEGIADLTRNQLGLATSWSFAHYVPGRATAGYQTSAHFLAWVEASSPGTVATLAHRLRRDAYSERDFTADGRSLHEMVRAYEELCSAGGGSS
jgi:hypothetical protein